MNDIRPPRDWQDAFAALPLEAPPATAAARFAAQLQPRPRPRPRWQLPAIAAAVCALAAVPALLLVDTPSHPPTPATVTTAPAPSIAPAAMTGVPQDTAAPAAASTPAVAATTDAPAASTTAAAVTRHPPVRVATATATATELHRLHGESARLEALLSELSAEDSGDVVQLSVAASLQAQVAGIDDALATAPLDADTRTGLWRERVEVLRQLTSVAAEQRLAALYGRGADYAVLPVY